MRRTASEIIRELELRVARLERQAARSEYQDLLNALVSMSSEDERDFTQSDLDQKLLTLNSYPYYLEGKPSIQKVKVRGNKILFDAVGGRGKRVSVEIIVPKIWRGEFDFLPTQSLPFF